MEAAWFAYDGAASTDFEPHSGVTIQDIRFTSPTGGMIDAFLVTPPGEGPFPGVLYVHWYEPHSIISNRNQFLGEAVSMAEQRGVMSLLVSTMWSETEWFMARDLSDDYDASVRQVIDLRHALEVLLARPQIDPSRIAYVGHDFGAMYGAVLAAFERRIRAYVLMAGTAHFADWYLLAAKIEGEARQQYIARISEFDPVRYIGEAGAPVLLQFAKGDFYVTDAQAQEFFDAAREPKAMKFYEAGHDLDDVARRDRVRWLVDHLGLEQTAP